MSEVKQEPLYPPPARYDEFIEGQPLREGSYPGFESGVHLGRGWPEEFGTAQRYFRVVGVPEALDQNDLSLRLSRLTSFWTGCHARMLELVPDIWKDRSFEAAFNAGLRYSQIADASHSELQRFDRAVLSVLFLQAVLEYKELEWPLYRYVRLRPVTFYIEGFNETVMSGLRDNAAVIEELQNKTRQPLSVLTKMAEGNWFVTRKTADLTLRTLKNLAANGVIGAPSIAGLKVQCGRTRTRQSPRRNIWPVVEENVLYLPDEYLSPTAWAAIPIGERGAIKVPPF